MSPEQGAAAATPSAAPGAISTDAGATGTGSGAASAGAASAGAGPASEAVELASAVVEPARAAVQHQHKDPPACANCGAAVPGNFCGRCGQRLEHEMHSVLHFIGEVTEDLTHADSRLWRTLTALLFKPGFLTREFIAGRRVRYLPPIRLYLVLSVLFFLVGGLHTGEPKAVRLKPGSGPPSVELVSPDSIEGLAPKPGETPQEREKRVCNPEYHGPLRRFVEPFLMKGCRKVVGDGGRGMGEVFTHALPKALLVLFPALALVMKGMYWRPRHYYIEHLLFFLHNHAFAFLVFGLLAVLTRVAPSSIGNLTTFIVWLYVPYYLFVSMRRVYGQGRWLTFAKLAVLSSAYFIGVAVMLVMTSMYSVYLA